MAAAKKKVLVTGGAGYIGSHTCVELQAAGWDVIVYDNFCNSHPEALARVGRISGVVPNVVGGDIRDEKLLLKSLREHDCAAVVHFAGLKAVGESTIEPLRYYDNNVAGSCTLLRAMQQAGVKTIVFSSSATVYGEPEALPLRESHPLRATNPYGRTKLVVEEMLRDSYAADPEMRIGILRYFNPVGAHPSGLIGEDPQGIPNNLMPFIAQVAVGRRPFLSVWGDDYPTPDGTGVRDYIHVVDLARGHVAALDGLMAPQCFSVNLGTGRGTSVLEAVRAFEAASGRPIPCRMAPRRPGDVAACYADPALARDLLGWQAHYDLAAMCRDHWRWQKENPDGYVRPA